MNFSLSLSYQEQNDNKAIVLTDASNWAQTTAGADNLTSGESTVVGVLYQIVSQSTTDFDATAGAPDNNDGTRFVATAAVALGSGDELAEVTPNVDEITAATLDTTIIQTDNTSTVKSQVNLISEFGPFDSTGDLVYTVTASMLGDVADTELVDGLYDLLYNITYTPDDGIPVNVELDTVILVYGQVKVLVYEQLRQVPIDYMLNESTASRDLFEAALVSTYLASIETSAYVAKTEELLSMLSTLETIVVNGSNIVW